MNPEAHWLGQLVNEMPGYWWFGSTYLLLSWYEPHIWKKLGRWFPHPKGRKLLGRITLRLIVAITPVVNYFGVGWLLWEFYQGRREAIEMCEHVDPFKASKSHSK